MNDGVVYRKGIRGLMIVPKLHKHKHKLMSSRSFYNSYGMISRLVVETTYKHECENIVQHVCEELYHVPHAIHHHVVTPRPIFTPGKKYDYSE